MSSLVRSAAILLLAPGIGGCGLRPNSPFLERCAQSNYPVTVSGETSGVDGAVAVVVSEDDGRISLAITTDDDSLVHTVGFELAGAAVDELVGEVTAEVGVVFAGEGSEYGYMRLTDERGPWFEGGRSSSIDGNAQGGGAIDGPFILGDETGEACRNGGGDRGYGVELHGVLAAISDNGDGVLVDSAGTNGRWRGVDVRAVGVRAHRGVYEESANTVDGLGPGPHDVVDVVAYLYRASP